MSNSGMDWTDMIVGERMRTDQAFAEKVAASNFSRQQWGLIMTAVEFDIEDPADPERARLVADTSKVEAVLPELEKMDGGMGAPGGPVGGPGGGGDATGGSSGGLLSDVKRALGLGRGEAERERRAAAAELAQMYADDLQARLEASGRWAAVREAARAEADESPGKAGAATDGTGAEEDGSDGEGDDPTA